MAREAAQVQCSNFIFCVFAFCCPRIVPQTRTDVPPGQLRDAEEKQHNNLQIKKHPLSKLNSSLPERTVRPDQAGPPAGTATLQTLTRVGNYISVHCTLTFSNALKQFNANFSLQKTAQMVESHHRPQALL